MARQLKSLRSVQASADMNAAGRGADLERERLVDALGRHVLFVLSVAGYDTVEKLRAASDDGLLQVNGIDEFVLRRIREIV